MTDLTAIEKPFGLLDHATKAALQAHGGPWEVFLDGKWRAKSTFTWQPAYTYRVKPQTVKPRAMRARWNMYRNCFEIYVTNVDYPDGLEIPVSAVLP